MEGAVRNLSAIRRLRSEGVPGRIGQRIADIGKRALLLVVVTTPSCGRADMEKIRESDLREAAQALELNIRAIQRRDTEAYLSQYLDSPDLVIATSDSLVHGYFLFAEWRRASTEWPDTLIVTRPALVWIGPGVVWAGFEYTTVIAGDTLRGVSERLFSKTGNGWKIVVTGTNERCPLSDARCP